MAPPLRGSPSVDDEAPAAAPGEGDRLDSWKEIAAFLQRDVRTVQRWEKTAGLPVHRHASSRLRTAFAYRSELEAWWRAQPLSLDGSPVPFDAPPDGSAPHVTPLSRRFRRRAIAAGIVPWMAAALAIGIWASRPAPSGGDAGPESSLAVLMTPIEVPAAQADLAQVLTEAVGQQLRQHGLEIVAPQRVLELLALMRRDPTLPLTPTIGREVAVRDSRTDLLLTGEVHRLESGELVHLRLVHPTDGRIRASVEGHAPRREGLEAAVCRASRQLARAVREPAARRAAPDEALEQVTTASLPALRLYSAAVRAGERRQWAAAEMLARRAVAADPAFASAYAWIGWSMRQQGRPVRDCLRPMERALALAADTSEAEFHAISGRHDEVAGRQHRALAAYEALVRLQPRHRRGLDRLIDAYSRAGRVQDAVALTIRRAELAPGEFYANARAAHALTVWQPDASRAAEFIRSARRLATPEAVATYPVMGAWLTVLPVFHQWMAGEVDRAVETLDGIERGLDARIGRERDAFATAIGFAHLAFGQVNQAEHVFRQAATPVRQLNLALLALHVGDEARARESLSQVIEDSHRRPALFARVGLEEAAEAGLAAAFGSPYAAGVERVTRGFLVARRGRTARAVRLLQKGTELLRYSGEPEYFLAVESLARLHRAGGRRERAAAVLADATRQRQRTFGAPRWAGAYWMKLSVQLLTAHRRADQRAEAKRLAAELEGLLGRADDTHPFPRLIRNGGMPASLGVPAIAEQARR